MLLYLLSVRFEIWEGSNLPIDKKRFFSRCLWKEKWKLIISTKLCDIFALHKWYIWGLYFWLQFTQNYGAFFSLRAKEGWIRRNDSEILSTMKYNLFKLYQIDYYCLCCCCFIVYVYICVESVGLCVYIVCIHVCKCFFFFFEIVHLTLKWCWRQSQGLDDFKFRKQKFEC